MAARTNITFETTLERFNSNLWHFHIPVPPQVAQRFLKAKKTRVTCSINGSEAFHAAILSAGNGNHFINVNKKLRDALKLKEGTAVQVSLSEDDSEYGMPMPEAMEAVLAQDDAGNAVFQSLTPGKKRTLLYIVGLPKNVDLRIKRALVILEHLKQTQGKIDYKELNRMLKG